MLEADYFLIAYIASWILGFVTYPITRRLIIEYRKYKKDPLDYANNLESHKNNIL